MDSGNKAILNRFPFRTLIICSSLIVLILGGCSVHSSQTNAPDPHSFSRPDRVAVSHVELQLTVDFNKKELSGTARLSIKNHDGSNKLILDTNGLDIVSVTDRDGETPLPFHLGDSLKYLGRPLEITITPKTTEVVVYYHTRPGALALQWLEPDQTTSKQFPFLFTQSQAILARSWVPCQDTPGNKITYSATIKVAPPLRAVMSATPVQSDVENGVYRFRMDKPIPPYLIALAVGELEYRPLGPRSGVYAEPALIAKAAAEFRDTEKMIHIAEKLWGPYRWDRYDILVLPPSFPFGGMENARLTFVTPTVLAGDRSLVALIAHELSHSWSGNLVTCKVWNDFWLNEGFTTYLENRIMEELYGKDFAMMLSVLGYHDLLEEMEEMGTNSPDTRLKLSLEGRDPDEGLTGVPYEKGRLFLTLLENAFGRQKWDAFLKSYFDKYAFQAITTEDFLNYLNQQLIKGNQELQSLLMINQWVYESGLPENCPIPESREFARVEREVEKWLNGMPAVKINSENWTALHWLHFLRSLPPTLSQEQMKELDDTFHFTQSQNSEILFVWLKLSIHNHYSAADSTLQNFLMTVGRRKFVLPLYKEMIKTEKGKQRAREIYLKARSHYHPVTYLSIDPLLDVSG